MTFNQLIKEKRIELGMTQTEVAAACKAHYVTLAKLESTTNPPALWLFGRLVDVLQLDVYEAVGAINRDAAPAKRKSAE
jgi:DNA-binding XRE family transcriptional regulator